MAILRSNTAGEVVVLEKGGLLSGQITCSVNGRCILTLDKPAVQFEPVRGDGPASDVARDLLNHVKDILGETVLGRLEDPSYPAIAAFLPQTNSWDFIGTPDSKWKFLIGSDGRISIQTSFEGDCDNEIYCAFNPAEEGFPYSSSSFVSRQTLLNGYLPVSRMVFKNREDGRLWEQIAFARTDANGQTSIYVRVTGDELASPAFFVTLSPDLRTCGELKSLEYRKARRLDEGQPFYSELYALASGNEVMISEGLRMHVPEIRVEQACRGAILKALNTCVGPSPRYGVTRYFCDQGSAAESFPPTTITLVHCCLEWSMFDRARVFLNYYLQRYVTAEGRLDHRTTGASISEHGMVLDTIAKYVWYTRDREFLEDNLETVGRISDYLLRLREEGKRNPWDGLFYGLIKGCPEDDLRAWAPHYWYSGNCWAWRGLMEIGRVLTKVGQEENQPSLVGFGESILAECVEFEQDILRSMRQSVIAESKPPFLPPYPGYDAPFETMTSEVYYKGDPNRWARLSSYSNYRMYLEMLSAGLMDEELSKMVIGYRESKGGEFLGLTRLSDTLIDDWPLFHYLWWLLGEDHIKKFLMAYYAHMAHHQARDTFFAPEHTTLVDLSSSHCVPSQLTIPLATRWMLVYEERDREVLWLTRGTPRSWLEAGETIRVENAATRWGRVDYRVESSLKGETISLELKLFEENQPEEIFWKLRCPGGASISAVSCEGSAEVDCDAEKEHVSIRPRGQNQMKVDVALTGPIPGNTKEEETKWDSKRL